MRSDKGNVMIPYALLADSRRYHLAGVVDPEIEGRIRAGLHVTNSMDPIIVDDVQILGKVCGVFRIFLKRLELMSDHYGLVFWDLIIRYYVFYRKIRKTPQGVFQVILYIIHNDRIHGIVLRLETIMSVFFIKSLNRRRIIHKCNDHFTVRCPIADEP